MPFKIITIPVKAHWDADDDLMAGGMKLGHVEPNEWDGTYIAFSCVAGHSQNGFPTSLDAKAWVLEQTMRGGKWK